MADSPSAARRFHPSQLAACPQTPYVPGFPPTQLPRPRVLTAVMTRAMWVAAAAEVEAAVVGASGLGRLAVVWGR